jgi:hypothetical protein
LLDNDCDGLVDALDPGCQFPPESNCFDGIDNNGNGLIDCADSSCANVVGPVTTCGLGACSNVGNFVCFNGVRQDTCVPLPAGTEGPFGSPSCADGVDNDCDGFIDAADPGCAAAIPGDVNGDGVVNQADVRVITSLRNQPASACPACDLNGDGVINILDARKAVLLCTIPGCL